MFLIISILFVYSMGKLATLIPLIENRITGFEFPQLLPEVFAEEDPSVNSGLNGNEQETQVINYPQSANVRIIISNISMFSTSIPINDTEIKEFVAKVQPKTLQ